MRESIKYIGYYSQPEITPKRSIPLAGSNKMDYTISVLSRIFDQVEIISPATVMRGEKGAKGGCFRINGKVSLRFFPSIGNRNRICGRINYILAKLKLFLYLLNNTSAGEPILVYHSLAITKELRLAKRIKKFKLILELNEIYSDVTSKMATRRKKEMNIIEAADAFLFPNEQMSGIFNSKGLPYAVEYGIYNPEKVRSKKFDDGKIHVVYAGTFDPAKGGAAAAAAAAAFLPENYHIHILGFGSQDQIENLERAIEYVKKTGKCSISYDGQLDGKKFTHFLQKCHIGLSTQDPNAKFNATSFPSKILTYLANGLQVVSIDIPAISDSKLHNAITFYTEQSPEKIAEAILSVNDFTTHCALLKNLDSGLEKDLRQLFSTL